MVGTIIKFSAFTIFPSKKGREVKMAKMMVETGGKNFIFGNNFSENLKNNIVPNKLHPRRMALNQNKFPASAAVR
jgi:hypothetical protein